MKLTYWYSECPDDSNVYSIRAGTRKEAEELIAQAYRPDTWEAPTKVEIEYRNGFDLMMQCSDENHHYWEEDKTWNQHSP